MKEWNGDFATVMSLTHGFHDGFNLVGRDLYADAQQDECNETKDAVGALWRDASCGGRSVSVAEVYSYAQEHNRDCDSRVCHDC